MQVPLVSCGLDPAPIQRALLSGLFVNAAILLPDSESQMLSKLPGPITSARVSLSLVSWNVVTARSCCKWFCVTRLLRMV